MNARGYIFACIVCMGMQTMMYSWFRVPGKEYIQVVPPTVRLINWCNYMKNQASVPEQVACAMVAMVIVGGVHVVGEWVFYSTCHGVWYSVRSYYHFICLIRDSGKKSSVEISAKHAIFLE